MQSLEGWQVPLIGKLSDQPVTLFSLKIDAGLLAEASSLLVLTISFATRFSFPYRIVISSS
jgi:hypothetical protein